MSYNLFNQSENVHSFTKKTSDQVKLIMRGFLTKKYKIQKRKKKKTELYIYFLILNCQCDFPF